MGAHWCLHTQAARTLSSYIYTSIHLFIYTYTYIYIYIDIYIYIYDTCLSRNSSRCLGPLQKLDLEQSKLLTRVTAE